MAERGLDPQSWRSVRDLQPPADFRTHAEEVVRQSRERWDRLQHAQEEMRAVSETALSPRREVSVTAAWGGVVTEVAFPTSAHKRLPSNELATLVQATIGEAQRRVTRAVAAVLAPTLPPGMDAEALLSGEADLATLMPVPDLPASGGHDRAEEG